MLSKHPDGVIRCLLVQPEFPLGSFWNYKPTVELIGAKTPNMPLGLVTVAAILPQSWQFRLVDLNCQTLTEEDWTWAEIVALGGMLPQQLSLLSMLRAAKERGKFVIVGGPDPTSQPELYAEADALILDEGEITIPNWLESWRKGTPRGTFRAADKPDVTKSPVPRYDLLNLDFYDRIGLQISRGCQFNCEFCDIIELYGRKPRIKNPLQVVRELEAIRKTGYSGSIDIVDDNFIGNKRYIRREILPVLTRWNRRRLRPFYFTTEASMNLADDVPMMREMARAGFRFVFTGIETPDPELLLQTQKSQNAVQPIETRLRAMLDAGLMPFAGFILGFDGEKRGMDQMMIKCIEEGPVVIAMVGLLVALPNTQLTRRLHKEGRLLALTGDKVQANASAFANLAESLVEISDQTTMGLNFVTKRPRAEIIAEYQEVIRKVYDLKQYMDRTLKAVRLLNLRPIRVVALRRRELRRSLRGLLTLTLKMTRDPATRWLYWRNFWWGFFGGMNRFDTMIQMMAFYVHLRQQRDRILARTSEVARVFPDKAQTDQDGAA
jgi:radical SAM superfamily enzyme YgiQ (UPF0313 family)